jgi:hypothetical protein
VRLLALLLIALAFPPSAHAADVLTALEQEVDEHCHALSLAKAEIGDPRPRECAQRGVGMEVPGHDTKLLFGRYKARPGETRRHWYVDWHDTFVRARQELRDGHAIGRLRLEEAERYALPRGDAPRVFMHGQLGKSCRKGVPCGGPGLFAPERWISGLSHASALRAWLLAFQQSGTERDLAMVRDLIKVFELPVELGGVATPGVEDTHFAEYSYQRHQLVFNGFATAVVALAEAGLAEELPEDEREAAWSLYVSGITELEAEYAIAGACAPFAYDLLLRGRRAAGDRREDRAHAETSAQALERLAALLRENPARDFFSGIRAGLFAQRAAQTLRGIAPGLEPTSSAKCRRNPRRTPPKATRIALGTGEADDEHVEPARLPLVADGMTGTARNLRWTGWGSPRARARGTALMCRLGRCGPTPVTITADRRVYWTCSPARWYYRRVVGTLTAADDFRVDVLNVSSCH